MMGKKNKKKMSKYVETNPSETNENVLQANEEQSAIEASGLSEASGYSRECDQQHQQATAIMNVMNSLKEDKSKEVKCNCLPPDLENMLKKHIVEETLRNGVNLNKINKTEREQIVSIVISSLMKRDTCLAGNECIYKKNVFTETNSTGAHTVSVVATTLPCPVANSIDKDELALTPIEGTKKTKKKKDKGEKSKKATTKVKNGKKVNKVNKTNKIIKVNKATNTMEDLQSDKLCENSFKLAEKKVLPSSPECASCGHTLKELFQFCYSTNIDQRVMAYQSLVGVIDDYQKGHYDQLVDLPISNIFLLFRTAMDENNEAIIEITTMGLSMLFYNESDQVLLDMFYESYGGHVQPITCVIDDIKEKSFINELTEFFGQMNIDPKDIHKVSFDKNLPSSSMVYFELTKRNLMQSLVHTNIIERIHYILNVLRPENTTTISCFKILIAIAHSKKMVRAELFNHTELFSFLTETFLPSLKKSKAGTNTFDKIYGYPQNLVLKLIRVLLSTEQNYFLPEFFKNNIIDRLQEYILSNLTLNVYVIKLKVEAFRILKCLAVLSAEFGIAKVFNLSLQSFLQGQNRCLVFGNPRSMLLRQHTAAAFNAINFLCSNPNEDEELIQQAMACAAQWIEVVNKNNMMEITCSTMICSILDFVANNLSSTDEKIMTPFFVELSKLLKSTQIETIAQSCLKTSILFNMGFRKRVINPTLANLGATVQKKTGPGFLIDCNTPFCVLGAILRLKIRAATTPYTKYTQLPRNVCSTLTNYLCAYLNNDAINFEMTSNYFVQAELRFIASLLQCPEVTTALTGMQMYHITFNFMRSLPKEIYTENIDFLLESIFTSRYIMMDEYVQVNRKAIYEYILMENMEIIPVSKMLYVESLDVVLNKYWPFYHLKTIYEFHVTRNPEKELPLPFLRVVLLCTFKYVDSVNSNCPSLVLCSSTEQLMYYMMAFLANDNVLFEENIQDFLKAQILKFLEKNKNTFFNFDTIIDGISFVDLYKYLIEKFQSIFYDSSIFSALIMIPLAQKYDVKLRQTVWLEYVIAMRYVTCEEDMLIGGMEAYQFPREKNAVLLRDYSHAFYFNLLRRDSLPFNIINHHLTNCPVPLEIV